MAGQLQTGNTSPKVHREFIKKVYRGVVWVEPKGWA